MRQGKDDLDWDAIDRALIDTAKADAPPSGSLFALERALGLDAVVGPAPNTETPVQPRPNGGTASVGPAPSAGTPLAPPVPAASLSTLSLGPLKLLGAAVAVSGATYWAAVHSGSDPFASQRAAPPAPTAVSPTPTRPATALPTAALQNATPEAHEHPEAAPVPSTEPVAEEPIPARPRPRALRRTTEARPPSAKPSASATPLALEVELIERARMALAANDAQGALKELSAYDGLAPPRALAAEADLVRLNALLVLGRRAQAERVADALIERHPGDAIGRRAADLLTRFRQ